jgi:hypothetical protein
MTRPADLPRAEAFVHGTRARYVSGCRCEACRGANTAAYHERQTRAKQAALAIVTPAVPIEKEWTAPDGSKRVRTYRRACPGVDGARCPIAAHLRKDSKGGVCRTCRSRLVWNGLVDTRRVRRHLGKLARQGVGRRAVAAAADVSPTTLSDIRRGVRDRVRRAVESRILQVTSEAVADHAHVPARRTHDLLAELCALGFSKSELARQLGFKTPKLSFRTAMVTARTELAVARLYRRLVGTAPPRRLGPCRCARGPLELEYQGAIVCARCERPVREARAG